MDIVFAKITKLIIEGKSMTALFYDNDKGQERQFISEQWVILIIQYLLTMKSERKYISRDI